MTSDPELDPTQEEHVRRLLADARHDEPIPEDVAARIDAVLAGLDAEEPAADGAPGGSGGGAAPVVDLAARRRRRRGSALLAAAAAVVAVGVVAPRVLDGSTGAADSAGGGVEEQASTADDSGAERDGGAESAPESLDGSGDTGLRAGASVVPAPVPGVTGPVRLRADRFAEEVQAVVEDPFRATAGDVRDGQPEAAAPGGGWFRCEPAPYGPGRLVPVEYDGEPAVLALRPRAGDQRVAELLGCGTAAVLRSVTVPLP